jgi:hypothetical protein
LDSIPIAGSVLSLPAAIPSDGWIAAQIHRHAGEQIDARNNARQIGVVIDIDIATCITDPTPLQRPATPTLTAH